MCTGRQPFPADNTVAVLKRVREGGVRPIREINPDVPDWLCNLIGKLHAKDANAPFSSALEVADLLGRQLELLQRPFPGRENGSGEQETQRAEPASQRAEPLAALRAPRSALHSSQRGYLILVACLACFLLALGTLAVLMLRPLRGLKNQQDSIGEPGKASKGPVVRPELRRAYIPPSLLTLAGGGEPARGASGGIHAHGCYLACGQCECDGVFAAGRESPLIVDGAHLPRKETP
jgi:hypothetical protein